MLNSTPVPGDIKIIRKCEYMRVVFLFRLGYCRVDAIGEIVWRKFAANLPSCRVAGIECVPMVVEALRGWAPDSISTIRRIGDILGQRVNPSDPSHSTKHLFGRLSITLWRGNATLWIRRTPSLAPSSDGLT